MRVPPDIEKLRKDFRRMLHEVEAETDRDGAVSVDDMLQKMDEAIQDSTRTKTTLPRNR